MTRQHGFRWLRRLLLFLTPLALGVAVLAAAAKLRSGPEERVVAEVAQPLRVITARKIPVVPRAIGLGESRPKRTWQAVCEVKGRIVDVHPQLRAGGAIAEGELLIRIDDTDVKLAVTRLKAEVARARASVTELKANEANYRDSLRLEEESLRIANTELERIRPLVSRKAVSAAELDSETRSFITQKQLVQSARNKLNLLPTQIESAQAALQVAEANLAERKRDLERCEILAPFDCRLGAVNLEVGQFLSAGQKLLTAQSDDGFRIEAEFASKELRRLFESDDAETTNSNDATGDLEPDTSAESRFKVEATVRYTLGGRVNVCSGRFVRFREQLSDQTRSGIVVIETDAGSVRGGPPPIRGTLCEVELSRRVRQTRVAVPLSAIREHNSIFVLDNEKRLLRREVVVEFEQDTFAVVRSGIREGELVVVSQPRSAIDGSLVEPLMDEALRVALSAEATASEWSE